MFIARALCHTSDDEVGRRQSVPNCSHTHRCHSILLLSK